MPYEAALFYSRSEEIKYLIDNVKLNKNCSNYLITPENLDKLELIFKDNRLKLYKINL